MNRLELTIAAVLGLILAKAAPAGTPGPTWIEPEPTPPACRIMFGLPCHERKGPNDPDVDGDKNPMTKPTKPAPEAKKPHHDKHVHENHREKGNASANNRKGGNYERTGHSDNGHGNGRHNKRH